MVDAYCHLDLTQESPLADFEWRMAAAGVSSALLVETWDARNRPVLEDMLRERSADRFPVALCYRKERCHELQRQLEETSLSAIRMSTDDLRRDGQFCQVIYQSRKMLITHAEDGIGPLHRELLRLYERLPEIRVYVPHLGWPVVQGRVDEHWEQAMKDFAAVPLITVGVSAIAHFSSEPFPHADVRDFALRIISQFPATHIAVGSDFPLFEKERYASYMNLAREWVTSVHPQWSFTLEA